MQDGNAENGQPPVKRSRDRYGRERGERAPRGERSDRPDQAGRQDSGPRENQRPLEGFATDAASADAGSQSGTSGSSFEQAASARHDERPAMRSYFSDTAITPPPPSVPAAVAAVAAVSTIETPVPALAVTVTAPVVAVAPPASVPAVAPASIAGAGSTGLPKVQSFTLSVDALNQVAQGSGLSWVNSDSAKVAQVQAAIAAEAKPIHVPRVRAVVAPADASPLVLVETKRDLRSLQLPFEETRPE